MRNDEVEIRMTKEFKMTKTVEGISPSEFLKRDSSKRKNSREFFGHSNLVLLSTFVIGHSLLSFPRF